MKDQLFIIALILCATFTFSTKIKTFKTTLSQDSQQQPSGANTQTPATGSDAQIQTNAGVQTQAGAQSTTGTQTQAGAQSTTGTQTQENPQQAAIIAKIKEKINEQIQEYKEKDAKEDAFMEQIKDQIASAAENPDVQATLNKYNINVGYLENILAKLIAKIEEEQQQSDVKMQAVQAYFQKIIENYKQKSKNQDDLKSFFTSGLFQQLAQNN